MWNSLPAAVAEAPDLALLKWIGLLPDEELKMQAGNLPFFLSFFLSFFLLYPLYFYFKIPVFPTFSFS